MSILTQPDMAPLIGAISLAVGLCGLLLTLTGFSVTIVQLFKAKSKTQAVADALQTLERRTDLYDIIRELERASVAVETAAKFAIRSVWDEVYDHCETARSSIHKCIIAENFQGLEADTSVEECHEQMTAVMTHLNRARAGKRRYPDPAKVCEDLQARNEQLKAAQKLFSSDIKS